MSSISIEIECDNAAFDGENIGPEIARILQVLACKFQDASRQVLADRDGEGIIDYNGNRVGSLSYDVEPDEDEDEQELYDSVRRVTKWMSKDKIRKFVEECLGAATFDEDSEEVLVTCIVQCIQDKDATVEYLETWNEEN